MFLFNSITQRSEALGGHGGGKEIVTFLVSCILGCFLSRRGMLVARRWLHFTQDTTRFQRPETGFCPGRFDMSWSDGFLSSRAVELYKMLLVDIRVTATIQPFYLVAVSCFQWGKDTNIKRLKLIRGMKGQATENNVIFETKRQRFRDSCVAKPSVMRSRGLPRLLALIRGSNTRRIQCRLISVSTYPDGETAKCHPEGGNVVQLSRWVEAGQTTNGGSDRPLAEMLSTAVIWVRPARLAWRKCARFTSTFIEQGLYDWTAVSSLL